MNFYEMTTQMLLTSNQSFIKHGKDVYFVLLPVKRRFAVWILVCWCINVFDTLSICIYIYTVLYLRKFWIWM